MTWPQRFLLVLPFLLLGTTYLVFLVLSDLLGDRWGYLAGVIFYWGVWCLAVPWKLLGWSGIRRLFGPIGDLSGWAYRAHSMALVIPPILAFGFGPFNQRFPESTLAILAVSLLLAIINGTLEELLWRGLYIHFFPGRAFLGFIFPTAGFALWHLAPQVVHPAIFGLWVLVGIAALMGACWGWAAYRTGTIRWTTVSHILFDFAGLGAFLYFT